MCLCWTLFMNRWRCIKELLHPKNKNVVINHLPSCRSKPKRFICLRNTIYDILKENREACDCPIDAQTINTVKAEKKNIYIKKKKKSFIQKFFSSVSATPHRIAHAACVQRIFSEMALRWHRFFFAYKKYSRSFITLRLNHWWQMDYSDDVFYTFLGLDGVNCLAGNGTVTSLPVFIQHILKGYSTPK